MHVVTNANTPPDNSLTDLRAAWLFGLSAVLAKPLLPDACAAYRSLVRKALAARRQLAGPTDEALPRLNMVLLIAGVYFGQDQELLQMLPGEYP